MIQIRKNVDSEHKTAFQVFVDDVPLDKARLENISYEDSVGFICRVSDPETIDILINHRFSELPDVLSRLELESKYEWSETIHHIAIPNQKRNESFDVAYHFGCDLSTWKKPYSFAEYFQAMFQVVGRIKNPPFDIKPRDYGMKVSFSIDFLFLSGSMIISDAISITSDQIQEFHAAAEDILVATVNNRSVITYFDFPKEVAVLCEQYLQYFILFLRDLGVEATSELKHEAGQVLFSITPTEEHEALDKIRTALEVYLRLPANPVSNDMGHEIAIQRLESQVLRFQSDLKLAAAELQAKNATIEAHQLTIKYPNRISLNQD